MGKILIIKGADFSQYRIEKVDIVKQVEGTVDPQTSTSYSSSTVLNNNSSLKNNNQ